MNYLQRQLERARGNLPSVKPLIAPRYVSFAERPLEETLLKRPEIKPRETISSEVERKTRVISTAESESSLEQGVARAGPSQNQPVSSEMNKLFKAISHPQENKGFSFDSAQNPLVPPDDGKPNTEFESIQKSLKSEKDIPEQLSHAISQPLQEPVTLQNTIVQQSFNLMPPVKLPNNIMSEALEPLPKPESQPTINVTIGRLEVRAVTPPPVTRPTRPTTPREPSRSLEDYLKGRS